MLSVNHPSRGRNRASDTAYNIDNPLILKDIIRPVFADPVRVAQHPRSGLDLDRRHTETSSGLPPGTRPGGMPSGERSSASVFGCSKGAGYVTPSLCLMGDTSEHAGAQAERAARPARAVSISCFPKTGSGDTRLSCTSMQKQAAIWAGEVRHG